MENRCKRCGAEFYPKRAWQKFCSDQCRLDYHASTRKLARNLPTMLEELRQAGFMDAAKFLQNSLSNESNRAG